MACVKINIKDFALGPQFVKFLESESPKVEVCLYGSINGTKQIPMSKILLLAKDDQKIADLFLDMDINIHPSTLICYPHLFNTAIEKIAPEKLFPSIQSVINSIYSYQQAKIKDGKVEEILNNQILHLIETSSLYSIRYNMLRLLKVAQKILTQKSESWVLQFLFTNHRELYTTKKQLLNMISKYTLSYDERVKFLNTFHHSMDACMFSDIISGIPLGTKDKNVARVLNKSNKLAVCSFDAKDAKDSKKREALVKHIVKTPTSAKNIDFKLTITYDDLKKLPPVMRFKFLNWYFDRMFDFIHWGGSYYRGRSTFLHNIESRHKIPNLKVESIPLDKMKSLLFSVGLKKNRQVSAWIDKYEDYWDIKFGKATK